MSPIQVVWSLMPSIPRNLCSLEHKDQYATEIWEEFQTQLYESVHLKNMSQSAWIPPSNTRLLSTARVCLNSENIH